MSVYLYITVLCCKNVKLTSEPEHSKIYNVTCAPSKDSDQHKCIVIRGFHIRHMHFIIAAQIRNEYIDLI